MNRCLFYVINSPWVWCQWSQYLWKRDAPYQLPVLPILPFLKWTGLHCLGHFMGWDLSKEMNKTQVHYGEGNGTPLQYSCLENPMDGGAWWAAVHGVAEGWTRLSDFTFTFHFHAWEKEMATHSSVLAWRIPGMGEPGGLPSLGSHRVGHDGSDLAAAAAAASTLSLSISYSVILHLYLIYGSCIPVKESPQWRVERSSGI